MKTKVLDVSIRDSYFFSTSSPDYSKVECLIDCALDLDINKIEIGYFNPYYFKNDERNFLLGGNSEYFKFLERKFRTNSKLKFYLMLHPDTCPNIKDLDIALDFEPLETIRIIYKQRFEKLIGKQIERIKYGGKKVCLNITRASEKGITEIARILEFSIRLGVDMLYIADSNSSFFPFQVQDIFNKINDISRIKKTSLSLGFHAHDGINFALINSLMAVQMGASIVDSSMLPYGKYGKKNLNTFNLTFSLIKLDGRCVNPCLFDVINRIEEIFNLNSYPEYNSFLEGLLDMNIDQISLNENKTPKDKFSLLINQI